MNCRFTADNQNHHLACSSLFLSSSISVSLSLSVTCTHSDSTLKARCNRKIIKGENKVLGFQGINLLLKDSKKKIVLFKESFAHECSVTVGCQSQEEKKDLLQII